MYYLIPQTMIDKRFGADPLVIKANNRVELYKLLEDRLHNTARAWGAKSFITLGELTKNFPDDLMWDFWDTDLITWLHK